MIDDQTKPAQYTAIPPTTDTNYWRLRSSDAKTKVFVPIDTELHRALLIELASRRTKRVETLYPKRRNPVFRKP